MAEYSKLPPKLNIRSKIIIIKEATIQPYQNIAYKYEKSAYNRYLPVIVHKNTRDKGSTE
jgi:hypothetical protein